MLVLASSSLLRITITITCRHVALQRTHDVSLTRPRCGCDDAKKERKKETDFTAGVVLIHHRRCGVATVAQPTKHTTQKKRVRPTDRQKPAREGSPENDRRRVEDTRLSGSLSLDPVHPLGTSDLCLPRPCDTPLRQFDTECIQEKAEAICDGLVMHR